MRTRECPVCKRDVSDLPEYYTREQLPCGCYQEDPRTYWSILVPYVYKGATKWHPTEATGPFSTLSRGAYKTKGKANEWALENLGGHSYTLKEHPNASYIAPAFNAVILTAAVAKYWSLAASKVGEDATLYLSDSTRQETAEWMHTNHPLWIAQFNMDLVEWILVTYHGAKNEP